MIHACTTGQHDRTMGVALSIGKWFCMPVTVHAIVVTSSYVKLELSGTAGLMR